MLGEAEDEEEEEEGEGRSVGKEKKNMHQGRWNPLPPKGYICYYPASRVSGISASPSIKYRLYCMGGFFNTLVHVPRTMTQLKSWL